MHHPPNFLTPREHSTKSIWVVASFVFWSLFRVNSMVPTTGNAFREIVLHLLTGFLHCLLHLLAAKSFKKGTRKETHPKISTISWHVFGIIYEAKCKKNCHEVATGCAPSAATHCSMDLWNWCVAIPVKPWVRWAHSVVASAQRYQEQRGCGEPFPLQIKGREEPNFAEAASQIPIKTQEKVISDAKAQVSAD